MLVVTVSGKAESGKDTFSNMAVEKLRQAGKSAIVVHYASLLKMICKEYFGWDGNKDEKGRFILQYVGTDVVRKQKPSFWVEKVIEIVELFPDEWDYIFIPDTRFEDEIQLWKERGYQVKSLKIIRPNHISSLSAEQLQHASETALDNYNFDCTIVCENGLDNMQIAVERFLKEAGWLVKDI